MIPDEPPDPAAFLIEKGHCLVCGGPGSGKTTLAIAKAIARINVGLLPGQSVLFLSFSRAAVSRLIQAGDQGISIEFRDRLHVQTFHGFCWSLLGCHAYLLGAPNRIQILMPHDERAISNGIKPDNPEWAAWVQTRETLFLRDGHLAFDLFAPMALRLLRKSLLVKQMVALKYPLIIVDEAQDTGDDTWQIIRELKDAAQIICLADPDQQIFDHLPGVGPERIEAIHRDLKPFQLDLGQQNNRSPGTEIAKFGNDIIHDRPSNRPYVGVSRLAYNPKNVDWNQTLRKAMAIVYRNARAKGSKVANCAIIGSTGREVAEITSALSNGARPVAHQVIFDETTSLLASRLAAFMLEPKHPATLTQHIIDGLELLATIYSAAGTVSGAKAASNFRRWAFNYAAGGTIPQRGAASAMREIMLRLHQVGYTGDPRLDWLRVKEAIRSCTDARISSLAGHLDYLVAFGRGRFLAAGLLSCWTRSGTYAGARIAFDAALAQDSILGSSQNLDGVHVMNVHRAKGKQFDAVIIVRKGVPTRDRQWRSSFVWRDDAAPYHRSRKILRVAITRARKHVLILDPAYPLCPLLRGHVL